MFDDFDNTPTMGDAVSIDREFDEWLINNL